MRGDLEARTLEVLWTAEDPLLARDVLAQINETRDCPLAYTTVLTVLTRLNGKGAVVRQRTGRCYVYTAAAENEAALAVREVLDQHGTEAITHFLKQAEADPELRHELHTAAKF
jgi:predicted transcriptional regulator